MNYHSPSVNDKNISELMYDATATAQVYLEKAVAAIDLKFGQDYAKKNPHLVAAMLQACTADFQASQTNIHAQILADAIKEVAEEVLNQFASR